MPESKFRAENDFESFSGEIAQDIHPQEPVKLSDEELCRNAQRGCAASKDLLWKRYINFIRVIVQQENKHYNLPPNEVDDAVQELYLAFHVAMQRYNPQNHGRDKPASFKTFLKIVITHAFSTYCSLWRRYHKHIVINFDDETPLHSITGVEEVDHFTFYRTNGNGQTSLDWQVMLLEGPSSDRLAGILQQLKPKEKQLLEVWLQYGRDKDVAEILGISPVAAKLRRERLFCRIRHSVAKD